MTANFTQQAELPKIKGNDDFGRIGYDAAVCAVRSQSSTTLVNKVVEFVLGKVR